MHLSNEDYRPVGYRNESSLNLCLQEDSTVATLAAAAAQLEGVSEEAMAKDVTEQLQLLPEGEAPEGTPQTAAPAKLQRLDSPATPWVPQIGLEAAAVAAALAASRSATPASVPGSPAAARNTPGRRCSRRDKSIHAMIGFEVVLFSSYY